MEEIKAIIERVREEASTPEEKNAISRVHFKLQAYANECARETSIAQNGTVIG